MALRNSNVNLPRHRKDKGSEPVTGLLNASRISFRTLAKVLAWEQAFLG